MRITSKPVNVAALRQEWITVVDRWAFVGALDAKTRRVARRCCFDHIIEDLYRYESASRIRLLTELFEDVVFAIELDKQIQLATADAAGNWLAERLGVNLEGGSTWDESHSQS